MILGLAIVLTLIAFVIAVLRGDEEAAFVLGLALLIEIAVAVFL